MVGSQGSDPLVFWTALYAIASLLTVGVLVVAAVIGLSTQHEMEKSRHTQTLRAMSEDWEALHDSRREATKVGGESEGLRDEVHDLLERSDERFDIMIRVPNFFERLALAVNKQGLPFDMVNDWLGTTILTAWNLWAPSMQIVRERFGQTVGIEWETLARRVAGVRGLPLSATASREAPTEPEAPGPQRRGSSLS